MAQVEHTFVMIKPDGVEKGIFDDVIARFEKANLRVSNIKTMKLSEEIIKEHYAHILDKPFFPEVKEYMLSGNVIAMIVKGEDAVLRVREIIGPTKGAQPGTVRGDYGTNLTMNAIHASDSVETADEEIARFYSGMRISKTEDLDSTHQSQVTETKKVLEKN